MKRLARDLVAALAAILICATVWASVALAETPRAGSPISLGQVFEDEESVNLTPEGKEKVLTAVPPLIPPRGQCPQQAMFKVVVKQGDELWQTALAAARKDVIWLLLRSSGGCIQCEFGYEMGAADDVRVDYSRMQDRENPMLHTTSQPEKGTPVGPGREIVVTMNARDDANRWQTGIQSIQLALAGPDGSVRERVGGEEFAPVVREGCEGTPEPRTTTVRYTVPENPPQFVRFVAVAEDFANHSDFDRAEFPTGILGGIWRDNAAGREVYVVTSGNNVSSHYVEWRTCEHKNGTGNFSNTFDDFSGTIENGRILGNIRVCKYGTADAGWIDVPVKLTIGSDWKSLDGSWFNGTSGTWIPITFTWLRDN